jgi:hypothetical protein
MGASNLYSSINSNRQLSSAFFNRSLSSNPSELNINDTSQYSTIIPEIKSSPAYSQFVSEATKNYSDSLEFSGSYFGKDKPGSSGNSLDFSNGDLSTSIGGTLETDIYGRRKNINSPWSLDIGIYDCYNFDFHGYGYYKNSPIFTTGNNFMLIPQANGAISNYNINIRFGDTR